MFTKPKMKVYVLSKSRYFIEKKRKKGMVLDPSPKCEALHRFHTKNMFCSQALSELLDGNVNFSTIHGNEALTVT